MEKADPSKHTKRHEAKHTKFVALFRAVSCVFVWIISFLCPNLMRSDLVAGAV
jgi:hypothetical protein